MAQLILRPHSETDDLHWLQTHWGRGVERIFFIYDVPEGIARGRHHHIQCQMGLVCLSGSVDVYVQTPSSDQYYQLTSPNQLLLLDPTDWRMMYNFSENALLMAMADRPFVETTYIQNPYRSIPAWSCQTA